MGPFSAQIRTQIPRQVFLLPLLIAACLAVACDDKKADEGPTEPWLRDEAERKGATAPSRIRYRVEKGAKLELTLPTRRTKPTGRLNQVEGYVDFDLKDLARSKGRIHVDLSDLEMDPIAAPKKKKDDSPYIDALSSDPTGEAKRWLGLGEGVSEEAKRQRREAVFEFQSLRALSHPSAFVGSLRTSSSADRVRQVYATAEGELSMHGLSVHRKFSTTLLFAFPRDSESKVPLSVEVILRTGATVPLSEYEVAPRDEAGNLDATKEALLGSFVGKQAKISGALTLTKVGASDAGESADP